jgi:hypothetical protein
MEGRGLSRDDWQFQFQVISQQGGTTIADKDRVERVVSKSGLCRTIAL